MTQITVTIGRRNYAIACGDGQEERLRALADYLDRRGTELSAGIGHVSEPLLLVMIGLMVADELSDARAEIERLRDAMLASDAAVAETLNTLAARIEVLAGRFECS
ncbi:MAG: cell division protein ZapA [Alphaproteobacteria bacterium]